MTEPTLFDKTEPTVLSELERCVNAKILIHDISWNDHNRGYNKAIREVLNEVNRLKPTEIEKLKQAYCEGGVHTESAQDWAKKFE